MFYSFPAGKRNNKPKLEQDLWFLSYCPNWLSSCKFQHRLPPLHKTHSTHRSFAPFCQSGIINSSLCPAKSCTGEFHSIRPPPHFLRLFPLNWNFRPTSLRVPTPQVFPSDLNPQNPFPDHILDLHPLSLSGFQPNPELEMIKETMQKEHHRFCLLWLCVEKMSFCKTSVAARMFDCILNVVGHQDSSRYFSVQSQDFPVFLSSTVKGNQKLSNFCKFHPSFGSP